MTRHGHLLKRLDRRRSIGREIQIAGEIDLHPLTFPDRDSRQSIQKPIHDLRSRLGRRVDPAPRDDHGSVAVATADASRPEKLRQSRDEPHGRGGAEGRDIVLVHLITKAGVPDLVQANELVEAVRAAVWHQEAMEPDSKTRLSERLNRPGLPKDAFAS